MTKSLSRIRNTFDRDALARVCTMPEEDFADAYGMDSFWVEQPSPDNFYHFKDNGSRVLAVAHLDTVGHASERAAHFTDTEAGLVVHSRALDDRLGAYIILELLPKLGLDFDILLTVGEESGMSTASFFEPDKRYDWMIEFDRGGTDVVMYQYDDDLTRQAVEDSGARVGQGSFSDIAFLEHVGAKGFNWGVGYRDYHGPRAHAYLEDTFMMVEKFLAFHAENDGIRMRHTPSPSWGSPYDWATGEPMNFGDDPVFDDPDYIGDYIEDYPSLEELRDLEARLEEEALRDQWDRERKAAGVRLDSDWLEV